MRRRVDPLRLAVSTFQTLIVILFLRCPSVFHSSDLILVFKNNFFFVAAASYEIGGEAIACMSQG